MIFNNDLLDVIDSTELIFTDDADVWKFVNSDMGLILLSKRHYRNRGMGSFQMIKA